jgi:hypothetical protein
VGSGSSRHHRPQIAGWKALADGKLEEAAHVNARAGKR